MLWYLNITKRGKSHIEKGTCCQDYSYGDDIIDASKKHWVLGVVADGVGSCSNSQYGSEVAVNTVANDIKEALEKEEEIDDTFVGKLFSSAYEHALENIEAKADELERPFITFDTTLTLALFSEDCLYYAHCGDGGIVAMFEDGTYKMITERNKGETANSVVPLRVKSSWQFGRTKDKVAALAIMTDGVLDGAVLSSARDNKVYFPFFETFLTSDIENEEEYMELREIAEEQLSADSYTNMVRDDLSLVVLIDSNSVKKLPDKEFFDEEEWTKELKEYDKKAKEQLKNLANQQAQEYKNRKVADRKLIERKPEIIFADDIIVENTGRTKAPQGDFVKKIKPTCEKIFGGVVELGCIVANEIKKGSILVDKDNHVKNNFGHLSNDKMKKNNPSDDK